jgi:hypothetical protein
MMSPRPAPRALVDVVASSAYRTFGRGARPDVEPVLPDRFRLAAFLCVCCAAAFLFAAVT